MSHEINTAEDTGFVPDRHYAFDPPVTTNAAPPGGAWTTKTFADGKCLRYEPRAKAHVFIGTPVGEDEPHFFAVKWGGGSVARETPAPTT